MTTSGAGLEQTGPRLNLIEIVGPGDLDDFLCETNWSGVTPTFSAVDANDVPFLASLREIGGDETLLVYISTDEDGGPGGRANCDECGDRTSDWTPRFPVQLVVVSS